VMEGGTSGRYHPASSAQFAFLALCWPCFPRVFTVCVVDEHIRTASYLPSYSVDSELEILMLMYLSHERATQVVQRHSLSAHNHAKAGRADGYGQ
jgi:hypothetical protein